MADRFPLIVNSLSQKIEELISGDNLELTGNNIVIGGDTGSGKYLTSDGSVVSWGVPGDVYVAQSQTLTNKTLESATISGSLNTITNLPNTALVNSSILVNGVATPLGGSVTTPNDDTTYAVSMSDGASANIKKLILTAGGSGSGTDEVSFAVGTPNTIPSGSNAIVLAIDRVDDVVTISGTAPDADTVTTLQSAVGGTAQSGDITIAATGSSTVSQNASNKTITINSTYVDTITKIRATTGQVLNPGNFTFLSSGATSVAQGVDGNGDSTITYSSTDTVTRVKGGTAGSLVSGDVTFTGGNNVTVSQNQQTITIDSVDTDTVTRLASGNNAVLAGDFKFVATGATSISQNTAAGVTTFTITSVNSDTGATLTASNGIILSGTDFQLKNAGNFSGNTLLKWDSGNNQIGNSLITDNGSTVTITGDLVVDGTQTVLNTTTLTVEDNSIELRKGNNLVGSDGGVQLNLETDSGGSVTKYQQLQWFNNGGYWRGWDGSVERRFVTETETQVLTNKTLTSPNLTSPDIGAAIATSVNGLVISSTASATIDIATSKILDVNDSITLSTDNPNSTVSVNLRTGGDVAYRSDTLASFSSTTSTQMRGLITDTTGLDKLVFQTNPTILTGITTTSAGFNLINSGANAINFGGAATGITIGATSGDTTFNHDLILKEDLTVGVDTNDNTVFNGNVNIENVDLIIRGTSLDPMSVGRGGGAVNTNTRVGVSALAANTSGSQNTAIGYQALLTNNIGASNTAIGNRVLRVAGVANNNIGIGKDVMLVTLSGSKNVAIGNNAMESNQVGDANVCIGHYAGYDILGNGNVLIGPADNETSADVTFRPPNISGDRQLVIGSGGQAWVRGDSNYDVSVTNDFTVNGSTLIKGNLVVNGTTTTVKSNIVQITDKAIELAAVVSTTFGCTVVSGSANITSIAPTLGLIPGMVVTSNTAGITVPTGTIIVSITNDTAVLSNNVTGSGTPTFSAIGPSDTAAEDGGIIVKGTSDKTFLWRGVDGGVTYNSWLSSEHIDVASGKNYYVNGIMFASDTNKVIGPTNGGGQGETNSTFTLGSAVTGSSLTTLGTLTGLTIEGALSTNGRASAHGYSCRDNFGVATGIGNGMYSPNVSALGFATNSIERIIIGSDGKLKHDSVGAVAAEFTTASASGAYHKYELGASGNVIGYTGSGAQLVTTGATDDFAVRAQANLVFSSGGSTESLRMDANGYVGIHGGSAQLSTVGLSVAKYGTQPAPNGNTYGFPAGSWSTVFNATGTANSTDYWAGFVGGYEVSSATVNISLTPNFRNLNEQAGIYIAGEATTTSESSFTIGKIISGSATGASDTAGTQRASKEEMFRIKPIAGDTNRIYVGGGTSYNTAGTTPTGDDRTLNLMSTTNGSSTDEASIAFSRSNALGGSTAGQTYKLNSDGSLSLSSHNVGEKMRHDQNGRVNFLTDTTGGPGAYGQIEITKNGASDVDPDWAYISLHRVANIAWQIGIDNATSAGQQEFSIGKTGGAVRTDLGDVFFRINSTGRVEMSGVPGVAGSNLTNLSIESDGNLCTTTSLRQYKTNIATISDTSWLYDLNPVTFDWKKKTEVDGETIWEDTADGNGTQYGLIAEEVQEVKDEFCYYGNDGKLSGVHYERLIAPLLKVVQQQKEEIEALKARVTNLEG